MRDLRYRVAVALLMAGCTQTADVDVQHLAVAETNQLGVVALEVTRSAADDTVVVELRALDAAEREVASIRRRTGIIADLPTFVPGADTRGSDVLLTVGTTTRRFVSRELDLFHVAPSEPELLRFLELETVRSALDAANIRYIGQSGGAAEAPTEAAYNAWECTSSMVQTTPVAKACCYDPNVQFTTFVNPSDNVVYRYFNRVGSTACRASDGTSTCSGTACYYGPHGYSRPSLVAPTPEMPYPSILTAMVPPGSFNFQCSHWFTNVFWGYGSFPNVTGTLSAGAGCCVNGSGPCNAPGRPECSTCGGGGSAGVGTWDY